MVSLSSYIADVDTIMKGADPVRAKQQLDQARDNPELDEALEELSDGLKEGESPFEFPIVYIRPKAKRAAPEAPTKAPSPWANDAPQIERGALPSSFAPNAAPPVTTPIPPEGAKGARGSKRRLLPSWRVSALAVLAALSPVMLVLLFLRLHGSPGTSPVAPSASGQASAPSSATAPASASAPASVTAPASATVAPPAGTDSPAVEPIKSAPPGNGSAPRPKHPSGTVDPHVDAAPGPSKTVEPVAPPPPPAVSTTSGPTAPASKPEY